MLEEVMGLGFIYKLKKKPSHNVIRRLLWRVEEGSKKGSRCEGPLKDCSETHSPFIRKLSSLKIVLSDNDLPGILKTELVV